MYNIGIDIGGMSVKVGLVDNNGVILYKNIKKTAKYSSDVIINIKKQIDEILSKNNITVKDIGGIGIGCPGAISSKNGIVEYNNNLGWSDVHIVEELKKYYNTTIKVSNDANVATLGETIYGAGKGYKNSVMLTLGTGVGGGVVIDGKLFEGFDSKGTELGHVTLVCNGIKCSCGRKGCIESYCSATALINQTKKQMLKDKESLMWKFCQFNIDNVDGKTAFECSKKGDKSAKKIIDKYINYLAQSIMSMINIFRPEVFIIGGGICNQKEYLINKLKVICEKYNYGYKHCLIPYITTALLGNDAGIVGASALI